MAIKRPLLHRFAQSCPQFWLAGELWFTYNINMSQGDLITTIQEELQSLNRTIDYKIIKGFSYKDDAKRHHFLTRQLSALTQAYYQPTWLGRASKMVATFMF